MGQEHPVLKKLAFLTLKEIMGNDARERIAKAILNRDQEAINRAEDWLDSSDCANDLEQLIKTLNCIQLNDLEKMEYVVLNLAGISLQFKSRLLKSRMND